MNVRNSQNVIPQNQNTFTFKNNVTSLKRVFVYQAAIVMETLATNALLQSQSTNVLRIHAIAPRNQNVNVNSLSTWFNLSKLFANSRQ